jgi:hypothetical protein
MEQGSQEGNGQGRMADGVHLVEESDDESSLTGEAAQE